MSRATIGDLQGGDRAENAQIIRHILAGGDGPKRDIVLMNAAPALVACGKAKTLQEAVKLAGTVIDSGAALEKLEALRRCSQAAV
jgi:anthranilate phosphoribosyltransferase